jgi:hypothetical protein
MGWIMAESTLVNNNDVVLAQKGALTAEQVR